LPGYGGAPGGEVLSLVRALPWWAFRQAKANDPAHDEASTAD
jgi:hypothetical protein